MSQKARHWFFDLDGTLLDTAGDVVGSWKKTIADLGLECPQFDEVFFQEPTTSPAVSRRVTSRSKNQCLAFWLIRRV